MEEKWIFANWKMKLGVKESIECAKKIAHFVPLYATTSPVNVVLCPSVSSLALIEKEVGPSLKRKKILLGAQDVFGGARGPYTGAVSVEDIKEIGARYVIVGHSERRALFHETEQEIREKLLVACHANIIPILCMGETKEEKRKGKRWNVIAKQLSSLAFLPRTYRGKLFIAYEPVWAISPNPAATKEEINEIYKKLPSLVREKISNTALHQQIVFLYGGNVNKSNIVDFIPPFAGVLVGSASVDYDQVKHMVLALSHL